MHLSEASLDVQHAESGGQTQTRFGTVRNERVGSRGERSWWRIKGGRPVYTEGGGATAGTHPGRQGQPRAVAGGRALSIP